MVSYRNAFACKNTPSVSTYDGYHPDHDVAVEADPEHRREEGNHKPQRKEIIFNKSKMHIGRKMYVNPAVNIPG